MRSNMFSKLSGWVIDNKPLSGLIVGSLIVFGALSYGTLMRREGFPTVQVPVALGSGEYFVNDANKVDREVSVPIADIVKDIDGVKSVTTFSSENTFQILADLDSSLTNMTGNEAVQKAINETGLLPDGANIEMVGIDAARFLGEYDILTSVYSGEGKDLSVDQLTSGSKDLIDDLNALELVSQAKILNQYTVNPSDDTDRFQSSFSRSYDKDSKSVKKSVTIGIVGLGGDEFDVFELDSKVKTVLDEFNESGDLKAVNTADITQSVNQDISSLQGNVLMGAIVVAIISALMISWRVSVLTSIFIVAVLLVTIGVMYAIGYTLNVITLFSLVLALGLFVDDATIISESIYAKKDKKKSPVEVVRQAIGSIGMASFMGTLTTILVFSPLLFITGILGDFIFQMPMTVIISLIVSFLLSITLTPLLANYTMLGEDIKTRKTNIVGNFLANMIEKLRTAPKLGFAWGALMVFLSFGLIGGGMALFGTLDFDIFPAGKDGNNLTVNIDYPDNTSIAEAQKIASEVDTIVVDTIGEYIDRAMYGAQSNSNEFGASLEIELVHYPTRDVSSVEMESLINDAFSDFKKAGVSTLASNGGPPEPEYPFLMQVNLGDDGIKSFELARDIEEFLKAQEIEQTSGEVVKVTKTEVGNTNDVVRVDGIQQYEVRAQFDKTATTGVVDSYTKAVEEKFDEEELKKYGLGADSIGFDLGDDSDFEESFAALPMAALGALIAMIVLLAIQFRSLIKPLLILIALPFSFFGIGLGLNLTNNPLSFFSMIGMIGLIGIAVNNTILLVDNATQHQKDGMGAVSAIAQAMRERFRPLATTTLTTIAALVPLALTNPFWESLAVTIVFGLASSTLLVVLAFPYFYLFPQAIWRGIKKIFKKA